MLPVSQFHSPVNVTTPETGSFCFSLHLFSFVRLFDTDLIFLFAISLFCGLIASLQFGKSTVILHNLTLMFLFFYLKLSIRQMGVACVFGNVALHIITRNIL